MSPRHSGCKKNITHEVIVDSDDEDFEVVASDDLCIVYCFHDLSSSVCSLDDEDVDDVQNKSHRNSKHTSNRTKLSGKHGVFGKKPAPAVESDKDEV